MPDYRRVVTVAITPDVIASFTRAIHSPKRLLEKTMGGLMTPLEKVNSEQELLRQKLVREVLNEEKTVQQQAQKDACPTTC